MCELLLLRRAVLVAILFTNGLVWLTLFDIAILLTFSSLYRSVFFSCFLRRPLFTHVNGLLDVVFLRLASAVIFYLFLLGRV